MRGQLNAASSNPHPRRAVGSQPTGRVGDGGVTLQLHPQSDGNKHFGTELQPVQSLFLTCSAPTMLIGLHLKRWLMNLGMKELRRTERK